MSKRRSTELRHDPIQSYMDRAGRRVAYFSKVHDTLTREFQISCEKIGIRPTNDDLKLFNKGIHAALIQVLKDIRDRKLDPNRLI